jgi:hypothetical protein
MILAVQQLLSNGNSIPVGGIEEICRPSVYGQTPFLSLDKWPLTFAVCVDMIFRFKSPVKQA